MSKPKKGKMPPALARYWRTHKRGKSNPRRRNPGAGARLGGLPWEDKSRYIDHGFYQVTQAEAKALAGTVPKPGRERKVSIGGIDYWLARTVVNGKQVWTIRRADPGSFGPFPLQIRNPRRTSARSNPGKGGYDLTCNRCYSWGPEGLLKTRANREAVSHMNAYPGHSVSIITPEMRRAYAERQSARSNPGECKTARGDYPSHAYKRLSPTVSRCIRCGAKRRTASSRKNPPRARSGAREQIYPEIVAVLARKHPDEPHHCDKRCKRAGHLFEHKFKTGNAIYGSADGSKITIQRRKR